MERLNLKAKTAIAAAAGLFALAGGFYGWSALSFDAEDLKTQFAETVRAAHPESSLQINGAVTYHGFPLPRVEMQSVIYHSSTDADPKLVIQIPTLTLRPKLLSAFGEGPPIASLTLDHPKIRTQSLDLAMLPPMAPKVKIINATLDVNLPETLESITNLDLRMREDSGVTASFSWRGLAWKAKQQGGHWDIENETGKINASISGKQLAISGDLQNFSGWWKAFFPDLPIAADTATLPLKFQLGVDDRKFRYLVLDAPWVRADLRSQDQAGALHRFDFKGTVASLDLDALTPDFLPQFLSLWPAPIPDGTSRFPLWSLLPGLSQGTVALNVEQMKVLGRDIREFRIQADSNETGFTVNEGQVQLPGETAVAFFGIVSKAPHGWQFDGNFESQGKNLEALLGIEDKEQNRLREFRWKSNLLVSPKDLWFTQSVMHVDDTDATGTALFDLGEIRSLRAAVQLTHFDFDRYLSFCNAVKGLIAADSKMRVAVKTIVTDFKLKGKQGDHAEFLLQTSPNYFALQGLNVQAGDVGAKGDIFYDARGKIPFFSATLGFGDTDASWFLEEKPPLTALPSGHWSTEPFDFGMLANLTADLNLTFKRLRYKTLALDDARFTGKVADRHLIFSQLNGKFAEGRWQSSGDLSATEMPSLNLNFSLDNASIAPLLQAAEVKATAEGRLSMQGQVKMTGLSPASWATTADGSFAVAANRIAIDGIMLAPLVRTMPNLRTTADVANFSRQLFVAGSTQFASARGDIYVQGGKMHTINLTFVDDIMQMLVAGDILLAPWELNIKADATTTAKMTPDAPPFSLLLQGSMDQPNKQVDSRALEAYVAKRAAESKL